MKNTLILIGCIVGCISVGALSGFGTAAGLETWVSYRYQTLVQSSQLDFWSGMGHCFTP
jgi:purine-cytosine permease-like protein